MATKKPNCLLVCSAMPQGVSAQSFIHSFTLTHSAFNVHVVTPEGKQIDFVANDENSKRWLHEFKSKPMSVPGKLEDVDAVRHAALVIPSGIGAVYDLANSKELGRILNDFIHDGKPICAVGHGATALCSASKPLDGTWSFDRYSLTAPSLLEVSLLPSFADLPIIMEDFGRENGATISTSINDCVHVVVDRHLITGQNDVSTLAAVQNLILLGNARQTKTKPM